jgi:cysteine desulfurase / selenocysteine lyase
MNQNKNILNFDNYFPYLLNNSDKIYLDTAATALKPKFIMDSYLEYLDLYPLSTGRSLNKDSQLLNDRVEKIRAKLIDFYNAEGLFFTANATDSSNHIASLIELNFGLKETDLLIIGIDNHHANILPYMALAQKLNLKIIWVYLDQSCQTNLENLKLILNEKDYIEKKKLVLLCMKSNVLDNDLNLDGVNFDNKTLVALDATQTMAQKKINFIDSKADFIFASAHKMYGPTGLGFVWYKDKFKHWKPSRLGGGIVKSVSENSVEYYNDGTQFETGTQNYPAILAMEKVLKFLEDYVYTERVLNLSKLEQLEKFRPLYKLKNQTKIVSLVIKEEFKKELNILDVEIFLNIKGFSVRTGFLCAQPLLEYLGEKNGCLRISFGVYTKQEDIDKFCDVLNSL